MPSIINATTSTGLVSSADNSGSLQLATNNGTTAVTIDTSQNVGVGTTSPTARVGIPVPNYTASATSGMIRFQNPDVAADSCVQSYYVTGAGSDLFIGANSYVNTGGSTVRFSNSYASSAINIRRDGEIGFLTNTSAGVAQSRMSIDSSGRVTMPYQPAFMAHTYSTNGSLIGGTYLTVLFTTVVTNRGNHYNAGSGVFTCPVAGDYYVHFNFNIRTTGNNWSSAFILKNSTNIINSWSQPNADNQYDNCVVNCVLNCAANDTIIFGFHKDYDSPATSANYTHGSIYLLG